MRHHSSSNQKTFKGRRQGIVEIEPINPPIYFWYAFGDYRQSPLDMHHHFKHYSLIY
jgi:hypothetical protein